MTKRQVLIQTILLVFLGICLFPACALPPTVPPSGRIAQDRGENLFLEAENYYRRQAYQEAWQRYAAYLARYPKGAYAVKARLREAEILGLLGDWGGSLARYQALLAQGLEPKINQQVQYGIGRSYFKLGQYQRASQVLESLTATDLPGSLRFSSNALLTEIALKQGQMENAFARLRLTAQDLPSGDQEWFSYLMTRLVERATPAELEHLTNLYRDSPLCAPLLLRLAQVAQKEGRPAEAQRWLRTLKERYPQSQEARSADKLLTPGRALLGCLLPLSGAFAEAGRRVRQGMELAAQGAPVDLVFKDSPNNADTTLKAIQSLTQYPNLLAFLGPLASSDAQVAARFAQKSGIPLIALSQKADLAQTGELIFQVFLTPRSQVRRLMRATLSLGMNRYAVFAPDSPYGHTFSRLFKEEIERQGGLLVAQEVYLAGTRDFTLALSPLLTKFQPGTEGPPAFDALFIPDDAPTVAAIAQQVAGDPLRRVQFLGTNLVRPTEGQRAQARALEGILFPDAFFAGDPKPAVQNFIASFRKRYGKPPDYLATQGYMVVRMMVNLLEKYPSLNRTELPRKLLTLERTPKLPWFLGFSPDRQAELDLYLLTIKNGVVQQATTAGTGQSSP